MERIVKAGGREIRVKNTATVLYIYKAEFGRDFLADVQRMTAAEAVDVIDIMGVTWAMARNADKSVPPFVTWLDSFGMTDFAEDAVIAEVMDIVNGGNTVDRKND